MKKAPCILMHLAYVSCSHVLLSWNSTVRKSCAQKKYQCNVGSIYSKFEQYVWDTRTLRGETHTCLTAQSPPMLAPSLQPSCEVGPVEQQHGAAVPTRIVHKQSHLSMCEWYHFDALNCLNKWGAENFKAVWEPSRRMPLQLISCQPAELSLNFVVGKIESCPAHKATQK